MQPSREAVEAEFVAGFDTASPPTIGLEEEVMLLDARTLDLLPRAGEVVEAAADPAVKSEFPAAQVELVTRPASTVGEAATELKAIRARAAAAAGGIGLLAGCGVHPFACILGELSTGDRYERTLLEYASLARRQMVFGLHVHVAIRPASRALAVHNELRAYLPELAALAANSPFHAGADTGLQSIRPKISESLPRQGVPPAFAGVKELLDAQHWSVESGGAFDVDQWWWELRLHPRLGTIEVRVCDAQATVGRSAALAAVIQSLCVWLAARSDAGDLEPPVETWKIDHNRWSACRHGVHGLLADLRTGQRMPAKERLGDLLETLRPTAVDLGCSTELASAQAMLADPSPDRHRRLVEEVGLVGLVDRLRQDFLA